MSEIFINQTSPLQQLSNLSKAGKSEGTEDKERFSELLSQAVDEVNQLQEASGQEIGKILSGDIKDVHSAMIAMQEADLSFRMMMQVRGRQRPRTSWIWRWSDVPGLG